MTNPTTLAGWLAHWQALHTRPIELGLSRVAAVAARLGLAKPAPICITVGGTNGKGSTVALLDAMLRASNLVVGAYCSPHLLAYNERVRIDGESVDDAELVSAFRRVEAARGDVSLTWFEAGTLAALAVFEAREVDVAVLEVGMGGRLDAVNLIDADAAIVTTVDLDHQEFLGPDRETIGREKAGIFRAGRPAIVAELDPPQSVLHYGETLAARLLCAGRDFGAENTASGFRWWHQDGTRLELPNPALLGDFQRNNAAGAIAALHALRDRLAVPTTAIADGLIRVVCPGRLQTIAQAPTTIVDVAHNPQAVRELAAWFDGQPWQRTVAVFAAFGDKDFAGMLDPLRQRIGQWFVAGLVSESPRGLGAAATAVRMAECGVAATVCADVPQAVATARSVAGAQGRVLVFGSFHTVAAAMRTLGIERL